MTGASRWLVAGLLVSACALRASPIGAGVYNFAEPRVFSGEGPLDLRLVKFRQNLIALQDVRAAALYRKEKPDEKIPDHVPADDPLQQRSLLIKYLADRGSAPRLSTLMKLNLSAYLINAGNPEDLDLAYFLLLNQAEAEPDNFLLQTNLATAFFKKRDFASAERYQKKALDAWPRDYGEIKPAVKAFLDRGNWNQPEHDLYRNREEWFLKLIELRAREGKGDYETVDALFTDKAGKPLRFINEEGRYEPGKLGARERAKLPRDYLDIVQQLLLWLPDDPRLLWLYAELLAADDHIKHAKDMFKLVPRGSRTQWEPDECAAHRKILAGIEPPPPTVDPTVPTEDVAKRRNVEKAIEALSTEPPPYPWKHIGLAFALGMAVGLFAYWQFRELRRRRQQRSG